MTNKIQKELEKIKEFYFIDYSLFGKKLRKTRRKEYEGDWYLWYQISGYTYPRLSEDFIREFKNYLNWEEVSWYQNLSKEFIREMINYVDKHSIVSSDKITNKEYEEMIAVKIEDRFEILDL